MNNNLIKIIKEIFEATASNKIVWHEIENTYCLKSSYNNRNIIICRYPDSKSNKRVASFNFLGNDNYIIEPSNQWNEDEENFSIVNKLYEKACEKTPSASC